MTNFYDAIRGVVFGFGFQLMLVCLMFCFYRERRNYFLWKFIPLMLVYLLPQFFRINGVDWTKYVLFDFFGLGCIWLFLFCMTIQLICFRVKFREVLFFLTAGFAFYNLFSGANYLVQYNPMIGSNSIVKDVASFLILAVLFVSFYYIIIYKIRSYSSFLIDTSIGFFLCLTIFINYTLHLWAELWQLEGPSLNMANQMECVCCLALLVVQINVLKINNLQQEKAINEQMLRINEQQEKISKETIDVINMKCHDLKHQILAIESRNGQLDSEWISEFKDTVSQYDTVVQTGNTILDSILFRKNILFRKYNISFSYIVEIQEQLWMSSADLYSLFGNLLDNAFECERRMEEKKRNIAMNVRMRKGFFSIHVDNYCVDNVRFVEGMPQSTKGDEINHGFGMKSIRYIVQKYKGNMTIEQKEDIFFVDLLIPIPEEK